MNLFRYLVRKREGKGFRKGMDSGQWAVNRIIFHISFDISHLSFQELIQASPLQIGLTRSATMEILEDDDRLVTEVRHVKSRLPPIRRVLAMTNEKCQISTVRLDVQ
jgi:hypothetical protein